MFITGRPSQFFLFLILSFIAMFSFHSHGATSPFGDAEKYNAFFLENFQATSSEVEGRLAAGGNIELNSYNVGDTLPPGYQGAVMVAGGNILFPNGRVYYGDIYAGGSTSGIGAPVRNGMQMDAHIYENYSPLPVNFELTKSLLKNLSLQLSNLTANGTVSVTWAGMQLKGDCVSDRQVFNLNGDMFKTIHAFAVSCIPSGATVIINLSGSQLGIKNIDLSSLKNYRHKVLFNFYQATRLEISSVRVEGSVLAPLAHIENSTGTVVGQTIAKSNNSILHFGSELFSGNTQTTSHSNKAPKAVDGNVTVAEDNTASVMLTASDDNSDPLQYRVVTAPLHGHLTGAGSSVVYVPQPNFSGVDGFQFVANDGQVDSNTATVSIQITAINDAPVITSVPEGEAAEGDLYQYAISVNDVDNEQPSITLLAGPSGMELRNGVISWTPNYSDAGEHSVTVQAQDSQGASAKQTFNLVVVNTNRKPVMEPLGDVTLASSQQLTVALRAVDPDGDSLVYSATGLPEFASLDGTVILLAPEAGSSGVYGPVSVEVSDGTLSHTSTFMINVTRANQAPVITSVPEDVVIEGSVWRYTLIANDPEGDALTMEANGLPSGASFNSVTGELVWETTGLEVGSYGIQLSVTDSQGNIAKQNLAISIVPASPVVTHEGREFWLSVSNNHFTDKGDFTIYLVSPQVDTTAEIDIQLLNRKETLILPKGEMKKFSISYVEMLTAGNSKLNHVITKGAVHIEAGSKIIAYAMNQQQSTTDGLLLLPNEVLGRHYIAGQFTTTHLNHEPLTPVIDIVATEDDTAVTINPSMDAFIGVPGHEIRIPKDTPHTFSLNQGDIFKLQAKSSAKADLSGSIISATKKVAVFGTNTCLFLGNLYCDHVTEQLPPLEALGQQYLFAPLFGGEADTIRIIAAHDNTEVQANGKLIARLNAGDYFNYLAMEAQHVVGNKPFMLLQFANSAKFDLPPYGVKGLPADIGDPSMVLLSSPEQYLREYTVSTSPVALAFNYLNVVIPDAAIGSLVLDGATVQQNLFKKVTGTLYSYAQIAIDPGIHKIAANQPFGLTIYGYDKMESYAYSGGMAIGQPQFVDSVDVEILQNSYRAGEQACMRVKLKDKSMRAVPGVQIAFDVSGINNLNTYRLSDTNGEINFCYSSLDEGTDRLEITIGALTKGVDVTWEASSQGINMAPKIASLPALYYTNGIPYTYQVIARDINDDNLTYSVISTNNLVAISSSGLLTWAPNVSAYQHTTWNKVDPELDVNSNLVREQISVEITVKDNRGGVAKQSFVLNEFYPFNSDPVFRVQQPVPTATVGVPYIYDPDYLQRNSNDFGYRFYVTDVDGDKIYASMLSGPLNAQLKIVCNEIIGNKLGDPSCARLKRDIDWTPIIPGRETFKFEIFDSRGSAVKTQEFAVDVKPNFPPLVHSVPEPETLRVPVGGSFVYTLDIENDVPQTIFANYDKVRVVFENRPALLRDFIEPFGPFSAKTQLKWTPTANDIGQHKVRFHIADSINKSVSQEFTITVVNDNRAPVIVETALNPTVEATIPYTFTLHGQDPDGDPLAFSIMEGPVGFTISPAGVINWTPPLSTANTSPYILIRVGDGKGGFGYLRTSLNVSAFRNQAPSFLPVFTPTTAKVGIPFEAAFPATDREGSPITYKMTTGLPGAINVQPDASGRVKFTPQQTGTFVLHIAATDNLGAQTSKNVTLNVLAANDPAAALKASLSLSHTAVSPSDVIIAKVLPVNAARVPIVTLKANNTNYVADANLIANIPANTMVPGENIITATVDDGHEQVTVSGSVFLRDPTDTTAPNITIHSPASGAVVSAPVDVTFSASDNVVEYTLYYQRTGQQEWVELSRGKASGNVSQLTAAQFDPSMLINGTYMVAVEAKDANGKTSMIGHPVVVEGNLKIGHFSFTQEDLSIPLAGIPVSVSRTYDSRRRLEKLDFGHGWTVDYQNVRIEESTEPSRGWYFYQNMETFLQNGVAFRLKGNCISPTFEKTVTVALPNGDLEKFSVRAGPFESGGTAISNPDCHLNISRFVVLSYVPIEGTQSTLVSNEGELYLSDINNGNLVYAGDEAPAPVSSYTLTTKAGYVYQLDQSFGVRSITDPNGHKITYSSAGIVHSNGTAITFERDAANRIKAIVDPKGNRTEYTYDTKGDLVTVKNPVVLSINGTGSTFVYDSDHRLENMTDALGRRVVKNIYSDDGRLIAQEDNQGNRTEFTHSLSDQSSLITDRDQRSKLLDYDSRGNVLSEIQLASGLVYSDSIDTNYTYDEHDNQLTRAVGSEQYTHTSTYDAKGHQLTQTDPLENQIRYENYNSYGQEGRIVDEMGRVHDLHYSASGQLERIEGPEIQDAQGAAIRHQAINQFNENGLVESTTDLRGHVTTYTYYDYSDPENTRAWMGKKKTEYSAEGGVTTYTYDANLNVATESRLRMVNGEEVTETLDYDYDTLNRLVRTTYPDGSNTETRYDLASNAVGEKDRFGNWTETDFDAYNRETEIRHPDGSKETKTYTHEGLLLTHIARDGVVTRYEYDDFGRQWKIHNDTAGTYTETRYTQQGWVQYEWDERRNKTEYTYDLAGRRVSVIRHGQEGVDAPVTHSFTYYPNGELESETDALGRTTRYTLNALDQRTETVYHDLSTTVTEFDPMGARLRTYDQNNKATRFGYDGLGRLDSVQPEVSINDIQVPETTYTYDEVGNKLSQTDAKGNTTRWIYDYHGRVLSRTLPEGQQETFAYADGKGCLATEATTCASTTSPRLQTHTDFNGDTITTAYDVMGQVVSVHYSKDDKQETYSYTAGG
ncbi:MAG TPA: choice-of-anchor A family protein, partial [Cellvibrio sp.]|nr:choice-of-anchor A family protein [Cellvibrio sp.]